jgi:asparagine synthase (glutamine-hydrolysing)
MCGITGFLGAMSDQDGLGIDLLEAMTARVAHRGPDGGGTWLSVEDHVGLGNRRLAIVDRTPAGAQPMTNEDGTVRLTFNGEIYNHRALRSELESLGHTFRSRTDTEAVVHAYEEWGTDCFTRLIGMWAIAIWDSKRKRLLLSRDRLGIKPLYYHVNGQQLRFASEIKALLEDPRLRPEVDLQALSLYLTHMVAPAPHTLFRGIHKLPPATILEVRPGSEPRVWSYWDPLTATSEAVAEAARVPADQLEDFAIGKIREMLKRSVERRMMADVPIGVFLSGGVDSSSVAALMRQSMSGVLSAFSVGYDDPDYRSDLPHARKVARLLGLDHHEIVLTEQDLIGQIDDVLYHLDEPNACWVSTPIFALAREAHASGVEVILNGEGSDEIFGGYEGHLRATHLARLASSPLWKMLGTNLVTRALGPAFVLAEQFGGRARGTRDDLERLARGGPPFIGLQIALTERLKRQVLGTAAHGHEWTPAGQDAAVHIARARGHVPPIGAVVGPARLDELRWIAYLELQHRLPEMLLTRLDKMTMAHGVEGRVPFLDHELVEFAMALPGSLRMRGGQAKYLLKRAAEAWLPRDIVYQPKLSFGAPVATWMRGTLGRHLEAQLHEAKLVRDDVLRGEAIDRLMAAHRAGGANNAQAIWAVYCVARWYDLMSVDRRWRSVASDQPQRSGVLV